ncbi:hypothetical protein AB7813_14610 [Tardiphaga sp. 20_F10_N6_6]|uniref:hypothetical protein n=1 Tax=Tardiphaga sp. 20_F10_N6_6 TaxID=3240788 RepID=UPI003F8CB6A0
MPSITPKKSNTLLRERKLVQEHLLFDHNRRVQMGLYRRLPEFIESSTSVTDEQSNRLQLCLGARVSNEGRRSLSAMITSFVEHELISIRAPSEKKVLKEIKNLCDSAISCLRSLKQLQLAFNTDAHTLAAPSHNIEQAIKGVGGFPSAKVAAIDLIKRSLHGPIPATLALGPLVEACWGLQERFSRGKTGPQTPLYFYLFLVCLLNIAKNAEAEISLPTKDEVGRSGSGRTTAFFRFVREALVVAKEMAERLLAQPTITTYEREKALDRFEREHCGLSNSQLRLRLETVILGNMPGLDEFVAEATRPPRQGASAGSTPGRSNGRPRRKKTTKLL